MKKRQIRRYLRVLHVIWISLSLILIVCFLILTMQSPNSIFNVTAEVEQVQFMANEEMLSGWHLNEATIKENVFTDSTYIFTGSLELPKEALILVRRVSHGPLYINITSLNHPFNIALRDEVGSVIKRVENTNNFQIELNSIEKRIHRGETVVLPISGLRGNLETSRPVIEDEESEFVIPLLRQGQVQLLQQSLFNTGLIETGNFELSLGDQFSITIKEPKASGFVVVNELPNMNLALTVQGKNGVISKPGGNERSITANSLTRIMNDRFLSLLSIFIGGLFTISNILSMYMNYILFRKELK